jgi:hypothetical protein
MTGRSRWIAVTRSSDEKPVRLARLKQNRYTFKKEEHKRDIDTKKVFQLNILRDALVLQYDLKNLIVRFKAVKNLSFASSK